ncbi:uncharacterized protein LOC125818786 [Solanum verrucosum]|uniref:uncharacterized protein LOC125818786 n=1 Tax=Solanum verrucosum TaxID=315347 RepID=UPI0020D10148|nr:uncharacterized protein LOC125818786 [Solanum verrucosum]
MGNDEEDKGMEEEEIPIHQSIAKGPQKHVEKHNPIPKVVQPLPKISPPFPQRLKKKNEDEKFKKFLLVFKTLSINLPLVEALLEMPGYAKFMKELVTKKRSLDMKQLKSLIVQLGLGEPKSTTMRLLMADRSIKHPIGILYDILVKVDRFIFPANFVILDCEIDVEIPIIFGRPFLETGRALVDVEIGELKFRVNEDEVTFNVYKLIKHPSNIHVVSTIDVIDEAVANVSHLMCMSEPLEAVLVNYDEF